MNDNPTDNISCERVVSESRPIYLLEMYYETMYETVLVARCIRESMPMFMDSGRTE